MTPINHPLWKHKSRALLLPTPLAELDEAGEEAREHAVLAWLELLDDRRDPLHADAAADARGVHVPASVRSLRPPPPTTDEVQLRGLVHPLSGERSSDNTGSTLRLEDLRARYAQWIQRWVQPDRDAPKNPRAFAELWHEIHASANEPQDAEWLGQAPGHPALRDHTWLAQRTMASALVGARFEGNDACLLHVHCGPVQSFIEAARRTNDLWLGSYLVSLLAYQATKAIADSCGPDSVIYPHLATLPLAQRDLLPNGPKASDRARKQQWLRASQPNRFVAVVDASKATAIATEAANAVLARWTTMASAVERGLTTIMGAQAIARGFERFREQTAEHLEIDIVVQPWPSNMNELQAMLATAERTPSPTATPRDDARSGECYEHVFGLGRDTLGAQRRVLSLLPGLGDERTKCTQCGRREAMGPRVRRRTEWNEWWERLRGNLSRKAKDDPPAQETVEFRRGEALCAVCLTKRLACRYDLAGPNSELGLDWSLADVDRVLLRFPSVASIAAAPLRVHMLEHAAHRDVRAWMKQLRNVHTAIGFDRPGNLLPGLGDIGRGKELLDYDGTWLYARSYEHDTVLNDHDLTEEELRERSPALDEALEGAREAFGSVGRMLATALGKPKGSTLRATPYYAVVVLDVDEMGKWLDGTHPKRPLLHEILATAGLSDDDGLQALAAGEVQRPVSPSLHAEVSRRQGQMAAQTLRDVVELQHLGRVVYSGGDDLLAFVPLHTLWGCLRDMERAFTADAALGSKVGLSAGVAIYDWRSPLSLALRTARKAEGKAKQTKGCVVIDLEIRSGAPIELRLPWRLLDADGSCSGDLADLDAMVAELVSASEPTSEGSGKTPDLLRPSAAEVLRRELDTLRHEGLEDAFEERVRELVSIGGRVHPWLERMMAVEPGLTGHEDARILARKRRCGHEDQQLGQVVDFLLLLRFLVREHGGIEHQALYDEILKHREPRGGGQP